MSVEKIDKGFSKISFHYENLEYTSSLIPYLRRRIYKHLEKKLKPGAEILEINCGTGIDAVYLAKRGYRVLGTDIAQGMLSIAEEKVRREGLKARLIFQRLANADLDKLKPRRFDHIFSNFGGLNCSPPEELKKILQTFPHLLKPQGKITLVIMPKICLWEMARIFKGNKSAFRRLKKGGTVARIEGEQVRTFYYSAREIKQLLQPDFDHFEVENLSFIGPTGNRIHFPEKYPRIFSFLMKWDVISGKIPFLQGMGDYFIISAQKK